MDRPRRLDALIALAVYTKLTDPGVAGTPWATPSLLRIAPSR